MAEVGKYIYGIVTSKGPLRLSILHDSFGVQCVYTISYQELSAVVADSAIFDLTHQLKDTLARLLVKHQMVIEKIMNSGLSIIPMRLGTFAADENEIEKVLKHNGNYTLINDILNKTRDKIEIDLAVTWNRLNLVIQESAEEKEIQELKRKLLVNPKGISVNDQIKVGVLLKKALEAKRERASWEILEALKPYYDECRSHELMDDRMVMNTAFLIQKAKQKDFFGKVHDLDSQFGERLNFRCVGPLPPYSFYTLEIKKMQFQEIDWARKKLGLTNISKKQDEIKDAYQKKASLIHPDKNPGVIGMEKEFDEVVKAYKTLVAYSKACEQTEQDADGSSKHNEFQKELLFIKVQE